MRAPFCVVGWIAAAIIAVEIVAGVPCHPERQGAQIGDPPMFRLGERSTI